MRGPTRHPLDLKVLAGLYHVSKDADALVLEDLCGISQTSLKAWLPKFLWWLATAVYPRWVKLPRGSKLDYALKVPCKFAWNHAGGGRVGREDGREREHPHRHWRQFTSL